MRGMRVLSLGGRHTVEEGLQMVDVLDECGRLALSEADQGGLELGHRPEAQACAEAGKGYATNVPHANALENVGKGWGEGKGGGRDTRATSS